jgi:hypothetical protein
MGIKRIMVLLTSLIMACAATGVSGGSSSARISQVVYSKSGSTIVEVFTLDDGNFYIGHRGPGTQNAIVPTDFGTSLRYCSDMTFHCLRSALFIAVPKHGMLDHWSVGDYNCRSSPDLHANGQVFRITCTARGLVSVDFTYSLRQGVTRYRRRCPECQGQDFTLVGTVGLFPQLRSTAETPMTSPIGSAGFLNPQPRHDATGPR